MSNIEVDTDSLRDEGKVWLNEADEMADIKREVDNSELSRLSFFNGYPAADVYFEAYESYREEIMGLMAAAGTEFELIGAVLKQVADDYDDGDNMAARAVREVFQFEVDDVR